MAYTSNSVDLGWQPIAIPAVSILITFLGYSSQWLLQVADNLDPGPLAAHELYIFNVLLLCLWYTYYNACTTDPGHFVFPKPKADSSPSPKGKRQKPRARSEKEDEDQDEGEEENKNKLLQPLRWCRKCAAPKPARSHHCRHCKRCIPRMDHHCPWTNNCVSYTTFPHFIRFLFFTNLSLLYLLVFLLWPRLVGIYENRNLPYYLGPSMPALIHLVSLVMTSLLTEFLLLVQLISAGKGLVVNVTLIESWEIERHEALMSRNNSDGCATCPHPNAESDASDFEDDHCPEHLEFPYDVGFFENVAQGMGSRNPLLWFLPVLGSTTEVSKEQGRDGWSWPENGFNDEYGMWPPVDVEKERRERTMYGTQEDAERRMEFEAAHGEMSNEDMKVAFKARQEADFARQRARMLTELEEVEDYDMVEDARPEWVNSTGRDEEEGAPRVIEIGEDEEDLPLGEIVQRRKMQARDNQDD